MKLNIIMSIGVVLLAILVPVNFAVKIPDFFRGSPEIYSGYLQDSGKFEEAFTFTRALVIQGNSSQVQQILAESNPKGK